jgi:hypothetical protein
LLLANFAIKLKAGICNCSSGPGLFSKPVCLLGSIYIVKDFFGKNSSKILAIVCSSFLPWPPWVMQHK